MEIKPPLPVRVWGLDFNYATIFMSLVVSFILIIIFYLATRRLKMVPGRLQALVEFIVEFFDNILTQTFGKERGRRYLPVIGTLFLFIWLSNIIGILPVPHFRILGLPIPKFISPTSDYNTELALVILVLFLVHGSEMRIKRLWGYLKGYAQPYFLAPLMIPINLFGRLGQLISIHFRLFGNIFGGAVILIIALWGARSLAITSKFWYCLLGGPIQAFLLVIPILINGFFGLFIGTVQAFVFAILAMSYTAVAIVEE